MYVLRDVGCLSAGRVYHTFSTVVSPVGDGVISCVAVSKPLVSETRGLVLTTLAANRRAYKPFDTVSTAEAMNAANFDNLGVDDDLRTAVKGLTDLFVEIIVCVPSGTRDGKRDDWPGASISIASPTRLRVFVDSTNLHGLFKHDVDSSKQLVPYLRKLGWLKL